MLFWTVSASVLSNALTGKGVIKVGKGVIRAGQTFYCRLILSLISKYKHIIKMNLNFMVFVQ